MTRTGWPGVVDVCRQLRRAVRARTPRRRTIQDGIQYMSQFQGISAVAMSTDAFMLENSTAYQAWRAQKLAAYPATVADLMVPIQDPGALSATERDAILARCRRFNMAFYRIVAADFTDKSVPAAIGRQLGLHHLDGHLCTDEENISALRVMPTGSMHEGYIPYTDRAINWHTDGYYNTPAQRIRAMLLHCVADAASGGENEVMDHELAYILMRDENPEYIRAFMQADTMTIPANVVDGVEIRPQECGPVFLTDEQSGALYMRYTARARNVVWRQDATTQAAVAFMKGLFSAAGDYIFRYRLQPGEGFICNNVLHNRGAFTDDAAAGRQRLILRARYYDRIQAT